MHNTNLLTVKSKCYLDEKTLRPLLTLDLYTDNGFSSSIERFSFVPISSVSISWSSSSRALSSLAFKLEIY